MPLYVKILIFLGSILVTGALVFIIYNQVQISKRQQAIESQNVEQKQLIDGIVRSQTQWTTKEDLSKLITDNGVNLKAIQEDLKALHAEVIAINTIVAKSDGQKNNNVPSTNTGPANPNPFPVPTVCKDGTPCPNADVFGYTKKQQNLDINENFGIFKVPIGSIGFSAWQSAPWSIDIKPREYSVNSVIGTDENQRLYFYNKFTVNVDGKNYDIPIKTASTKQEYPESKFSWWNPRLFVGLDTGINLGAMSPEFIPSLNVGLMSYGRYKNSPDISVLQVGVGYGIVSKSPQLSITPIMYNVGKLLPLMNNTYIGPSLHIGINGEFSVMGGIRVGL